MRLQEFSNFIFRLNIEGASGSLAFEADLALPAPFRHNRKSPELGVQPYAKVYGLEVLGGAGCRRGKLGLQQSCADKDGDLLCVREDRGSLACSGQAPGT